MRPWYQPIVRLANGELVGFEALARWHRPSGMVELPGAFIGLAEETGLVTRLDLTILDGGLRPGPVAGGRPALRISVNFSGRHLDKAGWVDTCTRGSPGTASPPATWTSSSPSRPGRATWRGAREELARLRELGYAVWFDDFGTGWSELTHLVDVPVDGIKIDRFFTERLGGRADAVVGRCSGWPRTSAWPPRSRGSPPGSRRTGPGRSAATWPRGTSGRGRCTHRTPRPCWRHRVPRILTAATAARRTGRGPVAVVRLGLLDRHRPGDVEALHRLAVEGPQGGELDVVLDSLGDGGQPDRVRALHHQVKQSARWSRADIDVPTVDLHDVDRQVGESRQ